MQKLKALVLALVSVLVLTGCTTPNTRTVYSGPTVRVERQGRKTIVHDLTANRAYILTERRVKTEQTGTPKTLVSTDTLKITVQGSTTTIKTDSVRITITRHRLRR